MQKRRLWLIPAHPILLRGGLSICPSLGKLEKEPGKTGLTINPSTPVSFLQAPHPPGLQGEKGRGARRPSLTPSHQAEEVSMDGRGPPLSPRA